MFLFGYRKMVNSMIVTCNECFHVKHDLIERTPRIKVLDNLQRTNEITELFGG